MYKTVSNMSCTYLEVSADFSISFSNNIQDKYFEHHLSFNHLLHIHHFPPFSQASSKTRAQNQLATVPSSLPLSQEVSISVVNTRVNMKIFFLRKVNNQYSIIVCPCSWDLFNHIALAIVSYIYYLYSLLFLLIVLPNLNLNPQL